MFFSAAAQTFNELTVASLPDIAKAVIVSADFNRDGHMDLLLAGNTGSGLISRVYRNNGDSTFFNLGLGLPALENAAIEVADLDRDGWPDFILSGRIDGTSDGYFRIFINKHDETFQIIDAEIPQLSFPSIKAGDFNNDGKIDLFVMGMSITGNVSDIYLNNGDLTFTAQNLSFPELSDGDATVSDLNHDGFLDIVYCGLNEQLYERTYFYINNGDGNFSEKTTDIPNIQPDVVQSIDINSDGYKDIFISGHQESGDYITAIWQNNHFSSFTLHTSFTILKNAGMAYVDYNHDGFPDLVIGGQKEDGSYYSELNENNSGANFNASTFSIDSLDHSSYIWFDFNNNNRLDLLSTGYSITGQKTKIYAANTLPVNQKPGIPDNLNTNAYIDSVQFLWDAPIDDVSPALALTYELFLFDYNNKTIRTTLSDTATGERYVERSGSIVTNSIRLYNFTEGKYFWAVQAIDQAFAGSDFAAIDSFFIVHPISLGNDTAVCYNEQITLSVADVNGIAQWFSAKNPSTPFSTDKTINIDILETDTIWVNVTKDFGTVVSDSIIVGMYDLPIVELGADRSICPGSELELTQGGATDVVNWSTSSGTYSATNTTIFTNNYFSNDKVYVELTDANACTNTDSVNVLMNAVPVINMPEDTAICKFDTIHLTLDNTADSINWYSLSLGLLKTNSNTLDLYIENTDTIWIDAFTDEGCMNFDTIIINARELPVADAGEDQLICEGYSTIIGTDIPLTGATYLWSPNSNIDDINIANPRVAPITDTRYYVNVTDQYGCHADDSVLVQINPKGIFDIGQDTSVCPGESLELGGNPTATGSILEYAYEWSPTATLSGINSANPLAFPTETTTYRLVIFTGTCPVDTLYTIVTVNPLPEITIMNDTLAGFQEDVTLWASGGVDYEWTPEEYLDNAFIQNPIANLEQTTHFTVQVTNEFGCTDTSGVNIFVKNDVFVPELFTPNNDGNNDYFKVYSFGIKELSLVIYNDLGIVVFESNNLDEIFNTGWNGEYNGFQVKEGKYFWKIDGEFYSGEKVLFNGKNTGIITILR